MKPLPRLRVVPLSEILHSSKGTLMEALGIEILEITPESIKGRMPVDQRTRQIHGVLHGGASVALAETLGSVGGLLLLPEDGTRCVGLAIQANHLRSVSSGWVTAEARPIHAGRTTQVWEIEIKDDADRLVSVSRLTLAVVTPQASSPA